MPKFSSPLRASMAVLNFPFNSQLKRSLIKLQMLIEHLFLQTELTR